MIKNYFKLFIKTTSQNKLFTFLSLFGISLTIMFVMIFSMTLEKITSGSGPEAELKKIIFSDRVKTTSQVPGKGFYSEASCGLSLCVDYLKKVKSAEVISMYTGPSEWEFILNGKYQLRFKNLTDAEYWNLFNYKFLEGRPYTKAEVTEMANLAVITNSLKKLLFDKETNVLGKSVKWTSINLTVIGVVEDPPLTNQNAMGDMYFPYTLFEKDFDKYLGGFNIAFKASSRSQFKVIRAEAQEMISRLDAADTTVNIFLAGPYTQLEKMMARSGDPEEYSKGLRVIKFIMLALAFLLLPAVNLMALNFARIHERVEEIAIRKSFGADNGILRRQFLFENILMTLTGGIIGIVLSYVFVALLGNSLRIPSNFYPVPLSFSFNIVVFILALISCLIFGLLSGFLPAVRLSRMKPAVYLKGGEI